MVDGLEHQTSNGLEQYDRRILSPYERTRLQSPRQEIPSLVQGGDHPLEQYASNTYELNETDGSGTSDTPFKHSENENIEVVVQPQQVNGPTTNTAFKIAEEEEEAEDEGIPWF